MSTSSKCGLLFIIAEQSSIRVMGYKRVQHKTLHIETLNKLSNTYPMKLKIINYLLSETWLTDLDRSRSSDGSQSNVED